MIVHCAYDKLVDISELKPHPENNNRHSIEQIERLAKIIDFNGVTSPITVSKRTGYITRGHARLEAFKLNKYEKAPVQYINYRDEAHEYSDLTADNEIARWAELDKQAVYDKLETLDDFDVELLGIEDFELPEVETLEPQCDEDEVPEVKQDPITKRGDVWLLGKHRVMCGDSTMIDDVEKLMNGEKADMVFTDPPYGVSYQSNMRVKSEKFNVLKNDDDFLDIVPIINSYSRGFVFIWSTWKVVGEWLDKTSALGKPTNTIVWFKGGGGIGDLKKTFLTDWELALVWNRGHELTGKRVGSVWSIGKDKAIDYKHPTQKPVELAEESLDKCSRSGYNVMDLFLGSGSTLIACEKTNRKCYGMELDEKYCDVIIERYMKFTGRDDVILESTGEKYSDLRSQKDKE